MADQCALAIVRSWYVCNLTYKVNQTCWEEHINRFLHRLYEQVNTNNICSISSFGSVYCKEAFSLYTHFSIAQWSVYIASFYIHERAIRYFANIIVVLGCLKKVLSVINKQEDYRPIKKASIMSQYWHNRMITWCNEEKIKAHYVSIVLPPNSIPLLALT